MKNLFEAGRVLLLDLASTVLFLALYIATDNLFLAVGLGMALGVAQIGWQLFKGEPVEALQWLSLVLILASGTATFFTHDPRFVMLKPSAIYCIVGVVRVKCGWMNRYLSPRAAPVDYAWAGLMFAPAVLNIAHGPTDSADTTTITV